MDSKQLALLCRELADNKKAENTVILDVSKVSSVTDFFVITSGSTEPHIRAIVTEITDRLRQEHQLRPRAVEGDIRTPWQVIDYFDVIVHVMRTDVRHKYDLEGLWGDAPRIGAAEPEKPKVARIVKPRKTVNKTPAAAGSKPRTRKPSTKKAS
jgi:ribosome-associated protein